MSADQPKRRRFRISLRIAMLFVFFTALGLAWQVNKARKQREAVEAVKNYGGWVHYDYEFVNGKLTPGQTPWAPGWLRRPLGDELFQDVTQVSLVYDDSTGKRFDIKNHAPADDVLARLRGLTKLKTLLLKGSQATDEGLRSIGTLANLEELFIWDGENVTDAGVAHLKNLTRLETFHLSKSKITDAGLASLARLSHLEHLSLQNNSFSDVGLSYLRGMSSLKQLHVGLGEQNITDEGMKSLAGLTNLEVLDIQNSKVTDQGLESLKGLPNLKQIWTTGSKITAEGEKRMKEIRPNFIMLR